MSYTNTPPDLGTRLTDKEIKALQTLLYCECLRLEASIEREHQTARIDGLNAALEYYQGLGLKLDEIPTE